MNNPKTIPRIGRQEFLKGLRLLVQIVGYGPSDMTEEGLRERMHEENRTSETQPFKSVDDWLKFTLADQNRSIHVINTDDVGCVQLTNEGKNLIDAADFEKAVFDLLVRKSAEGFTYFHNLIKSFDEKMVKQKYGLGEDLEAEIEMLMTDTGSGSSVTAGTIAGMLKDFGLIEQEKNGFKKLNPATYNRLRGNPEDVLVGLVREEGSQMEYQDLEHELLVMYDWSEDQFEETLTELEADHQIRTTKHGGKRWVQVVE